MLSVTRPPHFGDNERQAKRASRHLHFIIFNYPLRLWPIYVTMKATRHLAPDIIDFPLSLRRPNYLLLLLHSFSYLDISRLSPHHLWRNSNVKCHQTSSLVTMKASRHLALIIIDFLLTKWHLVSDVSIIIMLSSFHKSVISVELRGLLLLTGV